MGSLPESEQLYYFQIKLIDAVKILALDYGTQKTLIPKKIKRALAYELLDDWNIYSRDRSEWVSNYEYFVEFHNDFLS